MRKKSMYDKTSNALILFSLSVFLLSGLMLTGACRGKAGSADQTIANLRAFAKLYGYVRFFHPSDEAARIDWDLMAIHGAERVKAAADGAELKAILEELFLPLAPTARIYPADEGSEGFSLDIPEDTSALQVVAWQHKGVGFGSANSLYRSIRLNRDNMLSGGQGVGVLNQSLKADAYRGKDFRLTARVRTDVEGFGNQAQIWVRVDRQDGPMGFFDNMSDRPIRSGEWKEYEISGRVDDDAAGIVIGTMLLGNGRAWVDFFELEVKDNGEWRKAELRNPGFEEGNPGDRPTSWFSQSQGYTFSLSSDEAPEGEQCLLIESDSTVFKGKLFDAAPAVGEVIDKELGAGLACWVPLALYSDERGTLGSDDRFPLDPIIRKLEGLVGGGLTADYEFVRLADVIIVWNVFQHFYPYFDVVEVDWDKELTNALRSALQDSGEAEFFYTLSRLVARLQDGHGNVFHQEYSGQAGFPIRVEWIEDRVVVTASEDPEHFQRGDVILKIDGASAEGALLAAEEFISGSPQWKRYKALGRFGYGKMGTPALIELERGTGRLEVEVERNFQRLVTEPELPSVQALENNVFYVDLDRATWQEIQPLLESIAKARGVIFDLRGYPKGNHAVLSHLLTSDDTSDAWMQVPHVIYPDQEKPVEPQRLGWRLPARKPHFEGQAVFITDGRAISYAESFLSFVEHYKLAEIVGQPTAGTNGNINPFMLPGNFRVIWTGMKVLKHDGSRHHLIGIQPTVPAKRTIRGVREGRDELFEKALEILGN
jgi:C-terminal processing protease CtpA/Prc